MMTVKEAKHRVHKRSHKNQKAKRKRERERERERIIAMTSTNIHSMNAHSLYCILNLNLCVGRSFHSYECALVYIIKMCPYFGKHDIGMKPKLYLY